ncbi:MAG: hypothetical protein NXI27_23935 [Alphaproteobacteria bacterium]|nr:hypothetical protein [Alphaproteobacteria bacterium]
MIAVLPYEVRLKGMLSDVPLDALNWPLGPPECAGTVRDLTPDDHVILYPRSSNFRYAGKGVECGVSLIIPEPYVIHRRNYWLAILLQKRFFRLITHRPSMARWARNALVMPFGGAWVDPATAKPGEKTKNMSLIASAKRSTDGHRLRHAIADWCSAAGHDVDLLGRAYRPIDTKEDGLIDYRYSVVIENAREAGYFTEKLIDSLLCETVPIYWGAPDIGHYFDLRGMVICESADEMRLAIAKAGPDDYKRRRTFIERNRDTALRYLDYEQNAAETMRDLLAGQ